MSLQFNLVPDQQWCIDNPLNQLQLRTLDDLKRQHIQSVLLYVEHLVDHFNCQFRNRQLSGAQIAALRNNLVVGQILESVLQIIHVYYSEDDRHIQQVQFEQEWTPTQQRKLVLFLANSCLITELSALDEKALTSRLFLIVNIYNIVFSGCDFNDDVLETLGDATRSDIIFSHVRDIMDRIFPVPQNAVCPAPYLSWTDRDHLEKLHFNFHEVRVEHAHNALGWQSIEDNDVNDIIRGELLYYASEHRDILLRALSLASRRHRSYEKAINATLLVMAYLAPWREYGFWKTLMETCTYPGSSCPMAYSSTVFAHYATHWQYLDEKGKAYIEEKEINPTEMLWRKIPVAYEGREDASAKLLCSALTYFTPVAGRPTRGALFCKSGKDLRDLQCETEASLKAPPKKEDMPPPPPPPFPPPPEEKEPLEPLRIGEMAHIHVIGAKAHGYQVAPEYNNVLLDETLEFARVGKLAMVIYNMDIAFATDHGRESLPEIVAAISANDEVAGNIKQAAEAYAKERFEELTLEDPIERAVYEAQAILKVGALNALNAEFERIDAENDEYEDDFAASCDAEHVINGVLTMHCHQHELRVPENSIDSRDQEGEIPEIYNLYDVGNFFDLSYELEQAYKNSGEFRHYQEPLTPPATHPQRIDGRLYFKGKLVGYRTTSGTNISKTNAIEMVETGLLVGYHIAKRTNASGNITYFIKDNPETQQENEQAPTPTDLDLNISDTEKITLSRSQAESL